MSIHKQKPERSNGASANAGAHGNNAQVKHGASANANARDFLCIDRTSKQKRDDPLDVSTSGAKGLFKALERPFASLLHY